MGIPLFRIAYILYDGRKVYVSKRGMVHLMDRSNAEMMVSLSNRHRPISSDDCVYARDLSSYGSRSLFLESLRPYVATKEMVIEEAGSPLDPAAFVLGPKMAVDAGFWNETDRTSSPPNDKGIY